MISVEYQSPARATPGEVDGPFTPATPPAPSAFRWVVCGLLFLATTINYMDRQVLGLLAPELQKQIGWNDLQYGHIVIAFQAAYAVGLLGVSYLIDRVGTKRGYSISIIVWSIAACLHAAARNVMGFTAARVLLGLGESGNFPSAIKTVAEWFELPERALATGIFNCGSNVGAILAPALVPWVAHAYGWQAAFIMLGVAGLMWVVLWGLLYRKPTAADGASGVNTDSPQNAAAPDDPVGRISVPRLLTQRQTWGFVAISIAGQPVGWFFLYWLPKFFSARYNLSISQMGLPLVVVYSMALVGSVCGGVPPKAMLDRGWSINASRKGSLAICALLMVPVAFAANAPNLWAATFMIGLGLAALGGWAANCYTVVSDLFPKTLVASVVGVGTFAGSIAGIAFAEFVGSTLQASHSYHVLFVIAGLACPAGVIALHALLPQWRPIEFASAGAAVN